MAVDSIEAVPRVTKPWLVALYVVLSFGLLLPLLLVAYVVDRRVARIDREGLTTRRGHRYLWRDLRDAREVSEAGKGARVLRWYVILDFGEKKLVVEPALYDNGREMIGFIEGVLGRTFERP